MDVGLLLSSRGKKVYRPFPQDSDSEREDSPIAVDANQSSIMNDPDTSHLRPLTRSSIKPRLLFPNARQKAERTAPDATDEEALTEIEDPTLADPKRIVTPVKKSFGPATPPTTGHATRSTTQKLEAEKSSPDNDMADDSVILPYPRKKISPFDGWSRTKPGTSAHRGKKRDAEHIEIGEENAKRVRSGSR